MQQRKTSRNNVYVERKIQKPVAADAQIKNGNDYSSPFTYKLLPQMRRLKTGAIIIYSSLLTTNILLLTPLPAPL